MWCPPTQGKLPLVKEGSLAPCPRGALFCCPFGKGVHWPSPRGSPLCRSPLPLLAEDPVALSLWCPLVLMLSPRLNEGPIALPLWCPPCVGVITPSERELIGPLLVVPLLLPLLKNGQFFPCSCGSPFIVPPERGSIGPPLVALVRSSSRYCMNWLCQMPVHWIRIVHCFGEAETVVATPPPRLVMGAARSARLEERCRKARFYAVWLHLS